MALETILRCDGCSVAVIENDGPRWEDRRYLFHLADRAGWSLPADDGKYLCRECTRIVRESALVIKPPKKRRKSFHA